MKRFNKAYVEITNICNLNCSFCPDTNRIKKMMSYDSFCTILRELRDFTDYIYFHLMGEPLLHPEISLFLQTALDQGFKPCITTNGTLLPEHAEMFSSLEGVHKISISLQAEEANAPGKLRDSYLEDCFAFGKQMEGKSIISYRLWNEGGANQNNDQIIAGLKSYFPKPWVQNHQGFRIGQKIFLELAHSFEWPDLDASLNAPENIRYFCYGLRDQIGVLVDGSVVPCCLDHNGYLVLGNILHTPLSEILDSSRAKSIYDGFSQGKAAEELCRKCGYASRFWK